MEENILQGGTNSVQSAVFSLSSVLQPILMEEDT